MNSVILHGRLVKDPELRYTNNNMAVAAFTVAVDRNMTKEKKEQAKANNQPTADFIRCIAFGRTAEVIDQYFGKGKRILLNGRIQTGSYTNKEGQKVYTTDVFVNGFEFVESNNQQNAQGNRQPQNQQDGYTNYTPYVETGPKAYPEPPDQQMSLDDELPPGFQTIDDDDIPF